MSEITWQQFDKDVDDVLRYNTALEEYNTLLGGADADGDLARSIRIGLKGLLPQTGYGLEDADAPSLTGPQMKEGGSRILQAIGDMLRWLFDKLTKISAKAKQLYGYLKLQLGELENQIRGFTGVGGIDLPEFNAAPLSIGDIFVGNDLSELKAFSDIVTFCEGPLARGYLDILLWLTTQQEQTDINSFMNELASKAKLSLPTGQVFTVATESGRISTKALMGNATFSMTSPEKAKELLSSGMDNEALREAFMFNVDYHIHKDYKSAKSASKRVLEQIAHAHELVMPKYSSDILNQMASLEGKLKSSGATPEINSVILVITRTIGKVYSDIWDYKSKTLQSLLKYAKLSVEAR